MCTWNSHSVILGTDEWIILCRKERKIEIGKERKLRSDYYYPLLKLINDSIARVIDIFIGLFFSSLIWHFVDLSCSHISLVLISFIFYIVSFHLFIHFKLTKQMCIITTFSFRISWNELRNDKWFTWDDHFGWNEDEILWPNYTNAVHCTLIGMTFVCSVGYCHWKILLQPVSQPLSESRSSTFV